MKKVFLGLAIVATMLTSCSKKEVEDSTTNSIEATSNAVNSAVNKTKEAAKAVTTSVLGDLKVPEFSVPGLQENVTEYAKYAQDFVKANGNLEAISKIAPQGKALLAKGKELAKNLKPEEMKSYQDIMKAIQNKMMPSH